MMVFIVTAAILFHLLLGYALITGRLNVLYLIAMAFIFGSPISVATLLPGVQFVKIGRVYLTVLIVVIGFLILRLYRFGPATMVFTFFIVYYSIAALWSEQPMWGIAYKGLFAATYLSGVMLAIGTRSIWDLKIGLRMLLLGSAAFAIFIFTEMIRNPGAITHVGRLMAWGINPNHIGQSAAPMLIIALFIALYDHTKSWRVFGLALVGTMAVIILYSGSRGGAGMAVLGAGALLLPLVKRPGLFITASVILGAMVYFGLGLVEEQARDRIGDVTFETRRGIWTEAMGHFQTSPIVGIGWVYNDVPGEGASTRNMHSIYMQILVEIGVVGMFFFILAMLFVCTRAFASWRCTSADRATAPYAYLMIGFFIAVFGHGVVEASTITGAAINAMMLGWSIAMIDRLPQLLNEQRDADALHAHEWEQWVDEYPDDYDSTPDSTQPVTG